MAIIGLSRTVSEIDSDFSRKSQKNPPTPVYFALPLKGFPLELGTCAEGQKTRMMGLPGQKKKSDDNVRRVDIILTPTCPTDRRTPGDSKDRAFCIARAVKSVDSHIALHVLMYVH